LPQPKHILIQKAKNGKLQYEVFSEEQKPEDVLHLLGYK
jgi:arginine decarboxylase